jgi:hypothetical protein
MTAPGTRLWLETRFPGLAGGGYEITSDATPRYNCIAWAAGDNRNWWEPVAEEGCYWPPNASWAYTLNSYIEAYRSIGFEICETDQLEPGYEKIAIYVKDDEPTHAARQLSDGAWTSKLGRNVDITHNTLSAIEGDAYGFVQQIMQREARRS